MIGPRTRKEHLRYIEHIRQRKPSTCDFCDAQESVPIVVEKTEHFRIIKNQFPYSLWDAQEVIDHLMIIPVRHIDGLDNMSKDEKIEFVDLLAKYENKGYNVYARSLSSAVKTVAHQHTHLFKTTGIIRSFFFMLKKPYFRIVK